MKFYDKKEIIIGVLLNKSHKTFNKSQNKVLNIWIFEGKKCKKKMRMIKAILM